MSEQLFDFTEEINSPFYAGRPVSPDYFTGRISSINKILRYANKASKGQVQHFFLTGERGIGKTSLAIFTSYYTQKNLGMTEIYVSNKGNHTLNSLIDSIISELLRHLEEGSIKDKIKNIFGSIESLEFKGTKVIFKSGEKKADFMLKNFPYYLNDLIEEINPEKGIFLVIDDINGLSDSQEFVDWYKNFADTVEVNNSLNLKLYILFAAHTEKYDNLVSKEPSFGRIFFYEKLNPLNNDEVRKFFIDMFSEENISCTEEALDNFIRFSQGLPLLMQQIGESAFWIVDDIIDNELSLDAISRAAEELGNNQFNKFLNFIRNYEYESILLKLGKYHLFSFDKNNFIKKLDSSETFIFDKFLENMLRLDILNRIGFRDEKYEFNSMLYYAYFVIKSSID